MTEEIATYLAKKALDVGADTQMVHIITELLDGFGTQIRHQIALDLEELETPTSISSDWYAASRRTKMAAIAIVKHGLPND